MAQLEDLHKELGPDGIGKCSVTMFDKQGRMTGFCNDKAWGKQIPNQRRYGKWRGSTFDPIYVNDLACPFHGGPRKPKKNV